MKQKSFIYILISFIAVNAIIEEIDSEGLFDYSNYEQGMTDSSIAFKTFYKNCNDKYISIKDDLIKKKEEIFKNFEKEELKEFKEFLKLDKKEDDKIKKNKIKESIKTLETIKIEMKEEKIENELSIKGNLGMIEKTVENNFELIKTKLKEDLNKKNEFFEETYKDLNKLEESIKSEIIEYENIIADLDTVEIKLKEENVSGFKFVLQKLIETKTCLKDGKNRKEALKKFKSVKTSFDKEYEKIKKQNKELGKYVNKLTSKKEILLEILKLLEKVLIENKSHKNNIKMCEKTEKEFVNEIKKLKVYFKNNEKIQNDFQYNEQTLKNKIYELKKDIEEYKNITEKLETVEKTLENVSSFEVFIQNLREMKKSLLDGESREKVLKKLENIKTSFAEGVNKNKHLLNSFLKSLTKSEEENYKKYQKKWKIPVIKDFDAKTLETANLKDFVINLKDYSCDLVVSSENFIEKIIKKSVSKEEILFNDETEKLKKLLEKSGKRGRKVETLKYLIKFNEEFKKNIKNDEIKKFIEENIQDKIKELIMIYKQMNLYFNLNKISFELLKLIKNEKKEEDYLKINEVKIEKIDNFKELEKEHFEMFEKIKSEEINSVNSKEKTKMSKKLKSYQKQLGKELTEIEIQLLREIKDYLAKIEFLKIKEANYLENEEKGYKEIEWPENLNEYFNLKESLESERQENLIIGSPSSDSEYFSGFSSDSDGSPIRGSSSSDSNLDDNGENRWESRILNVEGKTEINIKKIYLSIKKQFYKNEDIFEIKYIDVCKENNLDCISAKKLPEKFDDVLNVLKENVN